MKMTYRALKAILARMTEEELNCDVSVYDPSVEEFMELEIHMSYTPIDADEDDDDPSIGVLDEGHPYLTINIPQ